MMLKTSEKVEAPAIDALAVAGYVLGLMLIAVRWGDLRIARLEEFNRELSRRNDDLRRENEKLRKGSE
jgi:hypothetical protein